MEIPRDTSAAAHEELLRRLRAMSPGERVRLAAEMSDDVRRLAEAGLRRRHPEDSDEDVRAALADILLGSAPMPRPRSLVAG